MTPRAIKTCPRRRCILVCMWSTGSRSHGAASTLQMMLLGAVNRLWSCSLTVLARKAHRSCCALPSHGGTEFGGAPSLHQDLVHQRRARVPGTHSGVPRADLHLERTTTGERSQSMQSGDRRALRGRLLSSNDRHWVWTVCLLTRLKSASCVLENVLYTSWHEVVPHIGDTTHTDLTHVFRSRAWTWAA